MFRWDEPAAPRSGDGLRVYRWSRANDFFQLARKGQGISVGAGGANALRLDADFLRGMLFRRARGRWSHSLPLCPAPCSLPNPRRPVPAVAQRVTALLRPGSSGHCETFRSPPLASAKDFSALYVEVWGFLT